MADSLNRRRCVGAGGHSAAGKGTAQNVTGYPGATAASCRAFSLLELLVAASLAFLIVATAIIVWQAVTASSTRQTQWQEAVIPVEEAARLLARDITCATASFGGASNIMTLAFAPLPGATQCFSEISFFTAEPEAGDAMSPAFTIAFVQYHVAQPRRQVRGMSLMRKRVPLFPEGEAEEIECAGNILGFELLLAGLNGWTNVWRASNADEFPRLAKIRLTFGLFDQDHAIEEIAPVPAGMVIATPEEK